MNRLYKNNIIPQKKLAAVCGLFCPSCTLYIGNQDDPERLRKIANRLACSVDDLICEGCRSETLAVHCRSCNFKSCAKNRDIDFCGECLEFPCEELKKFQTQLPHRIELWNYQKRIKEEGFTKWFREMNKHYSCSKCGTLNSAYDLECRSCNASPSCKYVELHNKKIREHLSEL